MKDLPPIVPHHSLLPELLSIVSSGELAELWADESRWTGLYIDYHPPTVERLYTTLANGLRVSLHRLYPCEPDRALWHTHPWPSAVQILAGQYEHCTGFVDRHGLHCNSRSLIAAGTAYEMTDPLAWHSVRPIGGPVLSVMLTGTPWPASKASAAPKPAPQRPLTDDERFDLVGHFGEVLTWTPSPQLSREPIGR